MYSRKESLVAFFEMIANVIRGPQPGDAFEELLHAITLSRLPFILVASVVASLVNRALRETSRLDLLADIDRVRYGGKKTLDPELFNDEPRDTLSLLRSIVGDLVTILDREEPPNIKKWLGAYDLRQYKLEANVTVAKAIIRSLEENLTMKDYLALGHFRDLVAVVQEFTPQSVKLTPRTKELFINPCAFPRKD